MLISCLISDPSPSNCTAECAFLTAETISQHVACRLQCVLPDFTGIYAVVKNDWHSLWLSDYCNLQYRFTNTTCLSSWCHVLCFVGRVHPHNHCVHHYLRHQHCSFKNMPRGRDSEHEPIGIIAILYIYSGGSTDTSEQYGRGLHGPLWCPDHLRCDGNALCRLLILLLITDDIFLFKLTCQSTCNCACRWYHAPPFQ